MRAAQVPQLSQRPQRVRQLDAPAVPRRRAPAAGEGRQEGSDSRPHPGRSQGEVEGEWVHTDAGRTTGHGGRREENC